MKPPIHMLAALELLIFVLWSAAFVWIVLPLNDPKLIALNGAALFGLTVGSHLWRGTPLSRIGLDFSSFAKAARLLAMPTLVAMICSVVFGFVANVQLRREVVEDVFKGFFTYPLWAFFQQYVFHGYVYVRAEEAFGGRRWPAILIAASLYTLVHFPNQLLLVLCFPAGLFWSWVFSRYPNLYALAISHGLVGTIVKEFVKQIYWAGLSVGPRMR